jgi:CBS domain containing-hemolysin-like protein
VDADAAIVLVLKIALVIFLVLLNGFFVAAEFAIVKIRDTQLDALITRGHRRAAVARRIVRNLDAALSATQLGITLASLALGWFGKPVFAALLAPVLDLLVVESPQARGSIAFAVGFSIITFLHIVVGELAPKSLAIQKPLPTALWIARPLHWFYLASWPANWLLNNTALWLLRRVGIEPASEAELVHSEEELRLLFTSTQQQAGRSAFGRDIVLNALELRRRLVRDVMRPRHEIVALDTEASLPECLDVAERTRYSRLPLCEHGDLDRTLGVVHIKDLYAMRLKAKRGGDLLPAARALIYLPETARLERLLQLFLERRLHFAIVVDEYGGTVGMVTLENVLEELVGQIQDEFDQEKPLLEKTGEQAWRLSGALPLHELSDVVGEPIRESGITTVNGLVTQRLGGFPKTGDTIAIGPYDLRVEEMDGLRVGRLTLMRRRPPPGVAPG